MNESWKGIVSFLYTGRQIGCLKGFSWGWFPTTKPVSPASVKAQRSGPGKRGQGCPTPCACECALGQRFVGSSRQFYWYLWFVLVFFFSGWFLNLFILPFLRSLSFIQNSTFIQESFADPRPEPHTARLENSAKASQLFFWSAVVRPCEEMWTEDFVFWRLGFSSKSKRFFRPHEIWAPLQPQLLTLAQAQQQICEHVEI